jgi:hypothetical protein
MNVLWSSFDLIAREISAKEQKRVKNRVYNKKIIVFSTGLS